MMISFTLRRTGNNHLDIRDDLNAPDENLSGCSIATLSAQHVDVALRDAGIGVWTWTGGADHLALDPTAVQIAGAPPRHQGSITLQDWFGLIHPDDRAVAQKGLEDLLSGRHSALRTDLRVMHAEGRWIWVRQTGAVSLRDRKGTAQVISGTLTDVSADMDRLFQASSYKGGLNTLFEAVPEGLMTVDDGLMIKHFNPAAERLFGWQASEVIGQPLSRLLPEDDSSACGSPTASRWSHDDLARSFFANSATSRHMADWRTVDAVTKDGAPLRIVVTLARTEIEGRRLVVAAMKDVTLVERQKRELQDLTSQLNDQLQSALEADRIKNQFLSAISHELKTPLNAIIGFSSLIGDDRFSDIDKQQIIEYSHDIESAGKHLLQLINDIIDLVRLQERDCSLDLDYFEIGALLEGSYKFSRILSKKGKVSFTHEYETGFVVVKSNQRGFNKIVSNLVSNSVKFTDAGGKIKLSSRLEGDVVRISVADTGCGIAEDDIARLAQPFVQIDSHWNGMASGLGLGLAISRQLVEKMGGQLTIESQQGRGTTVSFTLPVADMSRDAPRDNAGDGTQYKAGAGAGDRPRH